MLLTFDCASMWSTNDDNSKDGEGEGWDRDLTSYHEENEEVRLVGLLLVLGPRSEMLETSTSKGS